MHSLDAKSNFALPRFLFHFEKCKFAKCFRTWWTAGRRKGCAIVQFPSCDSCKDQIHEINMPSARAQMIHQTNHERAEPDFGRTQLRCNHKHQRRWRKKKSSKQFLKRNPRGHSGHCPVRLRALVLWPNKLERNKTQSESIYNLLSFWQLSRSSFEFNGNIVWLKIWGWKNVILNTIRRWENCFISWWICWCSIQREKGFRFS